MKTETVKSVKIEFEGAEVDTIKSVISKISKEATKTGFDKVFTPDETTLIKDLNDKIKE